MTRSGSYWDLYESQANTFAAQLLMPKKLIISEGNKILESYEEDDGPIFADDFASAMARRFKVSKQAMEYRLNNLGILS